MLTLEKPTHAATDLLDEPALIAELDKLADQHGSNEQDLRRNVAKTLKGLIGKARGRVVVTTFASNVARMRAVCLAAQACGRDVVAGLIETHGRRETEQMLDGLEVLPRSPIVYRNRVMREFDLDGALTRVALREAVIEGALLRLRPKVMTVSTVIAGLLPIMWSTGTGSEGMRLIHEAAPDLLLLDLGLPDIALGTLDEFVRHGTIGPQIKLKPQFAARLVGHALHRRHRAGGERERNARRARGLYPLVNFGGDVAGVFIGGAAHRIGATRHQQLAIGGFAQRGDQCAVEFFGDSALHAGWA